MDYVDGCGVCDTLKKGKHLIDERDYNAVFLNSNSVPATFEIVPYDHLGKEKGEHPLMYWSEGTRREIRDLTKKTSDVQKDFARHVDAELMEENGIPRRDIHMHPDTHTVIDIIPQYVKGSKINIAGVEIPGNISLNPREANKEKRFGMPDHVTREIMEIVKDLW